MAPGEPAGSRRAPDDLRRRSIAPVGIEYRYEDEDDDDLNVVAARIVREATAERQDQAAEKRSDADDR